MLFGRSAALWPEALEQWDLAPEHSCTPVWSRLTSACPRAPSPHLQPLEMCTDTAVLSQWESEQT